MTAIDWCALIIAVAVFSWLAGMECCWRWYVAPRRRANPNPFGDLPPMQPNGDCGHACEYVAPYGFVPEADCPTHDPPAVPQLERAVWIATLDPFTREPNGGALPFTIRHNTDHHARN